MNSTTTARVLSLEEAADFAPEQVVGLSRELAAAQQQVDVFKHQLEWYQRQFFGHKSERRLIESDGAQLNLGELIEQGQGPAPQKQHLISAHTRSVARPKPEAGDECLTFFDETRVPVETIELPTPEAAGLGCWDGDLPSRDFRTPTRAALPVSPEPNARLNQSRGCQCQSVRPLRRLASASRVGPLAVPAAPPRAHIL